MRLLEGLLAEETLERSVVYMHCLHVFLHVAARAEGATAVLAHEVFLFEVDQFDVAPQRGRAAELLPTRGALGSGISTSRSTGRAQVGWNT